MSSFGSETATIAEVSIAYGEAKVHRLWIAIDPGSIVKAQVESAAALGPSSALFEQVVYKNGRRQAKNYDAYKILSRKHMPEVHVPIVESGAPMGGIGEPGLPGVPPAVANALAALIGQRIRSLPIANAKLSGGLSARGLWRQEATNPRRCAASNICGCGGSIGWLKQSVRPRNNERSA